MTENHASSEPAPYPGNRPRGGGLPLYRGRSALHDSGGPRRRGQAVPRDRRGRGLRGPLLPPGVPASHSRADVFDAAVLQAVTDAEDRWPGQVSAIEFAVDDVPPVPAGGVLPDGELIDDDGVPLARFLPPGVDRRGRPTKARIVMYRRPIEMRSAAADDLIALVADVLTEQLAAVLGEGEGED